MTLSRKIVAALDARSELGALPSEVSVEEGPNRLTLLLTATGPVGLAVDSLGFRTSVRSEWSLDELKAWGDRIAARVTYLMEPLVVLEQDPVGVEVSLRSRAPSRRQEQRSYYELRLSRHGEVTLSRFVYDETSRRRQPAPSQLTREMLERLVDDFVASVG